MNYRKGKSWEQIFGKEKAVLMRIKASNNSSFRKIKVSLLMRFMVKISLLLLEKRLHPTFLKF